MPTVIFKLQPSKYLLRLVFILYSLLLISLIFSACAHSILILYILSAITSFYLIAQKQQYFKLLAFHQKSAWKIYDAHLQAYDMKLKQNSFCSNFFIILNFVSESSEQKISLVLLPDSMIKQDFKALRIYLLNS